MPQIQQLRYTALRDSGPLRVAAYCRVSSDSEDQLNSYASQIATYTDYIGQRPDWALVDIYADEGLTGTKTEKRDDLKRLIADCRKGKIDKVIVKSISRFARNMLAGQCSVSDYDKWVSDGGLYDNQPDDSETPDEDEAPGMTMM